MGIQTNNQTLPSITKCKQGLRWWASHEFYPEAEGAKKAAFQGVMYNGEDFSSQRSCVVKFRNCGTNNENEFHEIIKDCEVCETYIDKFNTENFGPKLTLVSPILATMDTCSVFNGVFRLIKGYDRVIHEDDHVLLEERIEGEFTTFIDRFGVVSNNCPSILQSFCHFTYHESKGRQLVTNIQGAFSNGKFILSSPIIHSTQTNRGPDDNGSTGIHSFFSRHKCNDICSKFIAPEIPIPSAPFLSSTSMAAQEMEKFPLQDKSAPSCEYSDPPPPYNLCCNAEKQHALLADPFSHIAGVHQV